MKKSSKVIVTFFCAFHVPKITDLAICLQYTTENGTTTFSCQHGEKECQGNKAHACVLSSPDIPFAKQLSFINCTMSLTDTKSNETYPTTRVCNI